MNTVTVMIRAKLNGKYPYLPAVWNGNGRLKANVALVKGNEQKVEGRYYLRFTQDGRCRFNLVKGDAAVATVAAQKEELALKAKAVGIGVVEETKGEGIKLADAVAAYKAETKEHKAKKTYVAYACTLDLFVKGCNKTYVDQISRDCFLSFAAALKKGRGGQTVDNHLRYVYTFLNRHGKGGIVGKNDWPKYEVIEYDIYTGENVWKMLEACETLREHALVLFPADTGFRYGEVAHAEVGDIDFAEGTIQTRSKPEWGFTTKDHVGQHCFNTSRRESPTGLTFRREARKQARTASTVAFAVWGPAANSLEMAAA
jgi:hypothetical protein